MPLPQPKNAAAHNDGASYPSTMTGYPTMTPAMAAGVTEKLWEIGDIVALIETKEAEKPASRGPYRKSLSS